MFPVDGLSWAQSPEYDLPRRTQNGKWDIEAFLIGFCGAYYPGVKASTVSDVKFFYTYEEYDCFIKEIKEPKKKLYWKYVTNYYKDFFERYTGKKSDEKFLKYNAPLFVVAHGTERLQAVADEPLKNYHFYRIKDAFTAFQEISIYISNQLAHEQPILEIEDKYKLSQHGFDKLSFRHPTK